MSDARPIVGDVIAGKYRIDGVAGEGGMGIVYEAEHVILRQRVAVKVMLPGALPSAEALERFSLEASAIARIACEHVVRVMDAGTLPSGAPYVVMEYLEGVDLEKLLTSRGPLPPADVVDFALQALEALAHAHAARVVHRDLKCANLFLAQTSDGRRIVKLLDFGLALSVDLDRLAAEKGRVVGSPRYMSPEQLRKDALDPRTDLWSLGVVMYELIAGRPPFEGETGELVARILGDDPVRLTGVAPALADVVARCLAKDPRDRWASVEALAHALAPYGTGAWKGAVERIGRALANAAPAQPSRRFEDVDDALKALDSRPFRADDVLTRGPVSTAATLRATVPAPPSEPRPTAATTLTSAGNETVADPARLRILMIDDSAIALGAHADVLEEAGFAVRTTTSTAEFRDIVDRWKPHLVFMDTSGEDLCREVKAKHRAALPVVLVSHLDETRLAERAKIAGADAWLTKTGDCAEFLAFVRNICAITYSPEHLP